MEAIAGISQRILQIQSTIASLAPQPAVVAPVSALAASTSSTFGAALTDAIAAQGSIGGMSTATLTAPSAPGSGAGQVNAKGVPLELVQYGNGTVPGHALSPIDGVSGHSLWAPAARSFEAMRAAAARDGVSIGVTDSYRPFDVQVDLVKRKGLYSQGGLAAAPGTSNHGWGIALDLKLDSTAQAWMRSNAKDYGFVEDVPREPWHWTYRPTS
ncbi:M15 family metallopeptidase [Actinotalea sp. K2]|uniref:M15 family metallopeptidase n=1 Tax=Actinotalea sp. K2 TaxID=2939438 RepID=UPI002018363C|nr:M15 family metallopeptidase [Actinotalea sp. K2]MCL3860902.1 M15 family metallopeptidase [Actinotalea sp. K2]